MEQTYGLTPVGVRYICDECGRGEMKHTGQTLLSSPPQHVHACDSCGHEQTFRGITYPTIRWMES